MKCSILKSILIKRKSTRDFSSEKISDSILEELNEIIELGHKAGNIDCVMSKLVSNEKEKDFCVIASGFQNVVKSSPYVMLIGNNDLLLEQTYKGKYLESFGCQNSCIAAQNLLLYLTENDIATCWVGGFENEFLQNKLNLKFRIWVMLCFGLHKNNHFVEEKQQ